MIPTACWRSRHSAASSSSRTSWRSIHGWIASRSSSSGSPEEAANRPYVDEHTNIQPRPRSAATVPAAPDRPTRVEHHYRRDGALNLFAAFDTRTSKVYAPTAGRKRQVEFIAILEYLDREISRTIRRIHLVLDNSPTHTGKLVQQRLKQHPRFLLFHPPVHCSWMRTRSSSGSGS
ncbi:MAG: transposase [Planctomycetaceae bacterium]|nr:transposase [Planctomycetaceae bacterium]